MATSNSGEWFLLVGPESGTRDLFIQDLKKRYAAKDGLPPEYHRFYAADANPDDVVGLLLNGSLFAARKIVEFRGVESLGSKESQKPFLDYLAAPSETDILLLVSDSYSVSKAFEDAAGSARKKVFWELKESDKPGWVSSRLKREGIYIDSQGIESFLELVENETSAMEAACLCLASCFPPDSRLDADAVEAALGKSRREDAFSVFDRIAESDLGSALSVLDTVLSDRQGDPQGIIAALVWSFRKLARLSERQEGGSSPEEAFKAEWISSRTAQRKFRAAMRRHSSKDCSRILRAISETEGVLRSGYPASLQRSFLHLLLQSIMGKPRAGLILSGWKEEEYYFSD
ncbi:MAG: DNA polymerase III subunit delta [Spirochaetes bacterium]|nr:MAG: DNA polymerase III subunit delta [Spirochaetota bacterium]